MIRLKRAYEPAAKGDGRRVLVERLWPRGVPKARLRLDELGEGRGTERCLAALVRPRPQAVARVPQPLLRRAARASARRGSHSSPRPDGGG